MRLHLFLLASSFICFSCIQHEGAENVPDNIMSEEQLTNVLTECYLAEGASGINVKNVTGQKFDSTYLFNPLKENQISKPLFDSSISYYSKHPKLLKTIYDKVLEKLSQIQARGKLEELPVQSK